MRVSNPRQQVLGVQRIVWTCVSKEVGGQERSPKGKRDFEERVEPSRRRDEGTHVKGKDKHLRGMNTVFGQ